MSTKDREFTFKPMGIPVTGFLAHAQDLGAEAFAAKYDHPFLIGLTMKESAIGSAGDTHNETIEAMTLAVDEANAIGPSSPLFAVIKQTEDRTDVITLGRSGNNDIVVPDTQISKTHGEFAVRGTKVSLTDPGSLNGTFVDGDRILPMTATPLRSGNRVQFGSRVFLFLTPARFLADVATVMPAAR